MWQQLEHVKLEVSKIRTEAEAAHREVEGLDGRMKELATAVEERAVEAFGALETRFKRFEASEGALSSKALRLR